MGSNFRAIGLGQHVICAHQDTCGVCSWLSISPNEQQKRKSELLEAELKKISIESETRLQFFNVADESLRDRADLVYENGKLGFYQKDSRENFALQACPLMSKELASFYQEIKKISFPIRKGSVRIRVSPPPQSLRGVWLDFANEDIRDLLAEKTTLQKLMSLGLVEIGQKRKILTPDFKLKDPEFHPWTRTWVKDQAIDLYGVIGGFTQSGDLANRVIIREMEDLFAKATSKNWVEFGAGNGNLTFPLAGADPKALVKALEFDEISLEGLKKSLQAHPSFKSRIALQAGDFQRRDRYPFQKEEGILVNPPRSGLMKFLDPLFEISKAERPQDFIYMSCHLDSFVRDAARMKELGYRLKNLKIVDQFPHSPHFEILSAWISS